MLAPEELPLEPEPIEPLLGEVVLPEEPPVVPELLLPLDEGEALLPLEDGEALPPELELEPDLKCASHSWREIWPSLFLSTEEKLGWELLEEAEPPAAPLDELPVDELPVDELPLVADGEDEEAPLFAPSAMASDDSAKSAAAVVTVTVLSI